MLFFLANCIANICSSLDFLSSPFEVLNEVYNFWIEVLCLMISSIDNEIFLFLNLLHDVYFITCFRDL